MGGNKPLRLNILRGYLFLIEAGLFPTRELINVALCLFSALVMLICYPWRMIKEDRLA
jgi:hypothetical protein